MVLPGLVKQLQRSGLTDDDIVGYMMFAQAFIENVLTDSVATEDAPEVAPTEHPSIRGALTSLAPFEPLVTDENATSGQLELAAPFPEVRVEDESVVSG